MAIRHIGFSVIDKDGDLPVDASDIYVTESKLSAKALKKHYEHDTPEFSPYKVVRVLIDDGAEG